MKEANGYFLTPEEPAHRHYEALRALFVDGLSPGVAAKKFGLARSTFYALVRDFRAGRLGRFFASRRPGRMHSPLRSVLKDPIDDARVKVEMRIKGLAKTLNESYGSKSAAFGKRTVFRAGLNKRHNGAKNPQRSSS